MSESYSSDSYSKALQSCFTSSVRACRPDLLPGFLKKGLDPRWLDSHGQSPMQVAVETEQAEVVRSLEDWIAGQSGDAEGVPNVGHLVDAGSSASSGGSESGISPDASSDSSDEAGVPNVGHPADDEGSASSGGSESGISSGPSSDSSDEDKVPNVGHLVDDEGSASSGGSESDISSGPSSDSSDVDKVPNVGHLVDDEGSASSGGSESDISSGPSSDSSDVDKVPNVGHLVDDEGSASSGGSESDISSGPSSDSSDVDKVPNVGHLVDDEGSASSGGSESGISSGASSDSSDVDKVPNVGHLVDAGSSASSGGSESGISSGASSDSSDVDKVPNVGHLVDAGSSASSGGGESGISSGPSSGSSDVAEVPNVGHPADDEGSAPSGGSESDISSGASSGSSDVAEVPNVGHPADDEGSAPSGGSESDISSGSSSDSSDEAEVPNVGHPADDDSSASSVGSEGDISPEASLDSADTGGKDVSHETAGNEIYYDKEPVVRWEQSSFDHFLIWVVENKASDISLEPGSGIWIRLHGIWTCVTRRLLTPPEIIDLLDRMRGNQGTSSKVRGGQAADFAYEVKVSRGVKIRFRANATGCRHGQTFGMNLVLRTIPTLPPTVEELGIEPAIVKACSPTNGLILVTGVMGDGKSTTLAALLRHIATTQSKNIVTYEDPIEFDLEGIPDRLGPLVQSEIGTHFESFTRAAENTARRAANVVLIGESRDPQTLRGMIEMAEIGVTAFSTVHTRSVSETPMRIINVFSEGDQQSVAVTLIASLRLIIQQRLVPRVGGGRVALREYLVFTPEIREVLLKTPRDRLIVTIRNYVKSEGVTLLDSARHYLALGQVSKEYVENLQAEEEERETGK